MYSFFLFALPRNPELHDGLMTYTVVIGKSIVVHSLRVPVETLLYVILLITHIQLQNLLLTGSAASLNDSSSCSKLSNPPESVDSNESVAGSSTSQRDKDADLNRSRLGMDSDVEILSNPSQSSIEVLNR